MIGIIDYGMGNIHSVRKALRLKGGRVLVSNDAAALSGCRSLVLPGVGAFGDAMAELRRRRLDVLIREHIAAGRIFLGICLGMHLLFESSQESKGADGLGVFKGTVKRFHPGCGLKVPHMGWNQIRLRRRECPLFKGLSADASVYFCHSYYPVPRDQGVVAATTGYAGDFASIVWKDAVFAMQFHPEKSQAAGLKIIENFVNL